MLRFSIRIKGEGNPTPKAALDLQPQLHKGTKGTLQELTYPGGSDRADHSSSQFCAGIDSD
jgi:hypothetical protein